MTITVVQEAILNLLADAREFALLPDEGCCNYILRGDERSLRELMEAAGFKFPYGDNCEDVLELYVDPEAYEARKKAERDNYEKALSE